MFTAVSTVGVHCRAMQYKINQQHTKTDPQRSITNKTTVTDQGPWTPRGPQDGEFDEYFPHLDSELADSRGFSTSNLAVLAAFEPSLAGNTGALFPYQLGGVP